MNFEEIMQDKEFVQKISTAIKAEDKDQVKALLQEKGLDATEAEIAELFNAQNDELSEEDMENVAGGTLPMGGIKAGFAFAKWLKEKIRGK